MYSKSPKTGRPGLLLLGSVIVTGLVIYISACDREDRDVSTVERGEAASDSGDLQSGDAAAPAEDSKAAAQSSASRDADRVDSAPSDARPADARPVDAGQHDAGPADGGESPPVEAQLVPLANGRLLARLPGEPRPQTSDPFRNRFGDVAVEGWGSYRIGKRSWDFSVFQTVTLADDIEDVEEVARRFIKKRLGDLKGVTFTPLTAKADESLTILQVDSQRVYDSPSWADSIPSSSSLFVRHPDSTMLHLDFHVPEESKGPPSTASIARRVGASLRVGPSGLIREAGLYSFEWPAMNEYNPGDAVMKLRLPEGFVAVSSDWHDSIGFRLVRPTRPGESERGSLSFWIHNSYGDPLEKVFPGFPERRTLKVLGQPARFLSKQEKGRTTLATSFRTDLLHSELFITASAPDGPELEELLSILETSTVHKMQLEGQEIDAKRGRCRLVALDPNPPLNIRAGPSSKSAVAGQIDDGEELVTRGRKGGWLRVVRPVEGWVWYKNTRRDCP